MTAIPDVKHKGRCERRYIYSYLLHVVFDNPEIQGTRKSFRLGDTRPDKFNISNQAAFHVLRDLKSISVLEQCPNHPRKFRLSEYTRTNLAHFSIDERHVIGQRLLETMANEIVFRFRMNDTIKRQIYEDLGFAEWERQRLAGVRA